MTICQTDFDADDAQVLIYINDEFLGNCTEFNRQCGRNHWKQCGVVHQHFENTAFLYNGTQSITITLDARDEVHYRPCPYHLNGTHYYLFAQLTIECDSFDNYRVYICNLNSGTGDDSMQQFGCDTTDCDVFGIWKIPDDYY